MEEGRKNLQRIRHDVSRAAPLAAAAVARTIFGGLTHLWFRSVARRGFPLIQLQSRSLVAKARRNVNCETRATLWGLHYSGEVYLLSSSLCFGHCSTMVRQALKQETNARILPIINCFSRMAVACAIRHGYAHRRRGSVIMSTSVAFFAERAFFNASFRS